MGARRRIRTLLYDDQQIEPTELDLLHTPSLQRLYDLHQLGLTDRVFVDASHSRLHHTLGVLEQVDKLVNAIVTNLESQTERTITYHDLDESERAVEAPAFSDFVFEHRKHARLMGLLHDLTHAPFGHTLEDEIELQHPKHDDPDRQAKAYYRLLVEYVAWLTIDEGILTLEELGSDGDLVDQSAEVSSALNKFIDRPDLFPPPETPEFIDHIAELAARALGTGSAVRRMVRGPSRQDILELMRQLQFAMRGLLYLVALHKRESGKRDANTPSCDAITRKRYPFEDLVDRILSKCEEPAMRTTDRFHLCRDAFFLDIIGNTICADLLDYAKRDTHLAGMKLDYDADRIVENFTLVTHPLRREDPTAGQRESDLVVRTAISIFSHKLRLDVPGELINLLQVRFYVYQRMLYHPTKCIAGAMLGSALQLLGWGNLPKHLLAMGDTVFLAEVAESARLLRDLIAGRKYEIGAKIDSKVLEDLLGRLRSLPENSVTRTAECLLLERKDDLVDEVSKDIQGGLRLLARLSARRYHRSVFRLLPGEAARLSAEQIAGVFKKAELRAKVERQIEVAATLPRGTVVIHCPDAKGPMKLAEILMLGDKEEGQERPHKLAEIGKVHPEGVFDEHQKAVTAISGMYSSTWRLAVSVAPPHYEAYEDLEPIISKIIRDELLTKHPETSDIRNDFTMRWELKTASQGRTERRPAVHVVDQTGKRRRWYDRELKVAEAALGILVSRAPSVQEWISDGNRTDDVHSLIDGLIQRSPSNEKPLYDVLWRIVEPYTFAIRPTPRKGVVRSLRSVVARDYTPVERERLIARFEMCRLSLPAGAHVLNRDAPTLEGGILKIADEVVDVP